MKNASKKSAIATAVAGTVAAFTANERNCAAAIVKAYTGTFTAEDAAALKGSGAFGLCIKAFVSGATFKGMETAQPKLVADKVPAVDVHGDPVLGKDGKQNMVKTRLRSAWDSAKSIITRSHAAGFDLTDAQGVPVTKNELAKQLAELKAEPGAQTGNAADEKDAAESVKAETLRPVTDNELCGKAFAAMQGDSADAKALRTAFAEQILALADTVKVESAERTAELQKIHGANAEKAMKRAADKAARLAADKAAAAAELAAAGLTKAA